MMTVCRKEKIGEEKRGVERGDEVMTKTAGEERRQYEVLLRNTSTEYKFQYRERILCLMIFFPFLKE